MPKPALEPLPGDWNDKLTKSICKRTVATGVKFFIEKTMGPEYAPPYILPALKEICKQLDHRVPCLLLLSDGWDPAPNLQRILDTREIRGELRIVTLGSKGTKIEEIIKDAKMFGHWVLIHDVHFCSLSSLRELEALIEASEIEEQESSITRPEYQLFISSKSIDHMPCKSQFILLYTEGRKS
eukprot:CAMPEP_0117735580 /NCGR_PEP_ID=MMETSP0947-20121206/1398_1 /TAXON_ID=44440 /ORGANISM="Chattonella subsalsa, Strain CCMP2191" /LENGTH=182 /DNA_ID=CAMNT_0005550665 /DNA_START=23 /DNA_END=571 /DNA_ORIENTATION=+